MNNKVFCMETKISSAFVLASWLALLVGVCCFTIGLWNADMQLNEKGYYASILLLGLYSTVSLQKVMDESSKKIVNSGFYIIFSWISFLASLVFLIVGLYNAELMLSEKGFFGIAYFLCLFGVMSVQKNELSRIE